MTNVIAPLHQLVQPTLDHGLRLRVSELVASSRIRMRGSASRALGNRKPLPLSTRKLYPARPQSCRRPQGKRSANSSTRAVRRRKKETASSVASGRENRDVSLESTHRRETTPGAPRPTASESCSGLRAQGPCRPPTPGPVVGVWKAHCSRLIDGGLARSTTIQPARLVTVPGSAKKLTPCSTGLPSS